MFEVNQLDNIPFSEVREDSEIYTMPYPYPRYNKGAKAEVHVRIFLTTWQANHVSQRQSTTNVDASKIANFGLSLEGRSVN